MSNHSSHNNAVFRKGLTDFTNQMIKVKLVTMLKSVAQTIVDVIDGNFVMPQGTEQFPVFTANLHDATGVGVYSDGQIQYFVPTKRAADVQQYGNPPQFFYGSELLQQAISNAATKFSKGVWIVLFSTVPYAWSINEYGSSWERGQGFFDSLKQTLLNDVLANLKPTTL